MMNTHRNSLFTILLRLGQMLYWLLGVGVRLYRLANATSAQRQSTLQALSQSLLPILHIQLQHDALPETPKGTLIVANHISWLDIFVLNALFPTSFIAAKELQKWFVIGKMIAHSDAVFIDRTNRKDIDPINAAIAERLQSGGHVCFFPEAKTSSGSDVLPLKAALFQSAIIAQANIQVVALRYYDETQQRTERISFANAHFFKTLWRILSMPKIDVRVDFAPLINPQQQPEADRFALKGQAEHYLKNIVLSDSPQKKAA